MSRPGETAYLIEAVRFAYPGTKDAFELGLERLRIDGGTVLALVGPNGAGKTTLLSLLAFLARPSSGRIAFFGREPWEAENGDPVRARREAVLVTHHPYLFKGTVGDNLAFGLKVRSVPKPEWASRTREALALVELSGWEKRPTSGLSAGEVQRVALARALALRPKTLLLDEPMANLETGLSLRIEAVIGESVRERRTTVVFSTHDFSLASRLAAEVLYLSEGRPVPFGHENCFSGTAATDGARSWIEPGRGTRIVFPGARRGHVTCVINPSRIRIDGEAEGPSPGTDGANAYRGTVSRLEIIEGGRALVRIAGELTFRAIVSLAEIESKKISLSRPVLVRFDAEAVELIGTPPSDQNA
jgi:tungstate transport system ATP-binding protein